MKNKTHLIILALFLLAISLRVFNLERGFFGDESITMSSASKQLTDIIPSLVKNDANPPLTSLLLHLWMKVGRNEIFIRLYFIIFGMGTLLMIYLIARECLNEKVALLALFLGAISPMLISLSQFIRNYIDSAFWMLLSNYFLLLIIKNKGKKLAWHGYFLSAVFSIYTFYFSFILILCQSIYVFIFNLKEKGVLKKWVFVQCYIFILFIPWIKNFVLQFSNKNSSLSLHWEKISFKIAGFDLGIYSRNISSLFGMDYFFMVYPEGIRNHFSLPVLILMFILTIAALFLFLLFSIKWLKREFHFDPKIAWFLPFFSLMPVVFSWAIAKILKTLPNARYLAAPHAVFLILVAYFFYNLIARYKKTGLTLLVFFIFLYGARIPMAVTAIYEGNEALEYLSRNIKDGDCTVMLERLPGRENLGIPYFSIHDNLLKRDPLTSGYYIMPESDTDKVKEQLRGFKRIWFIRCYGNAEIFGGNKIAYDFLNRCGLKEISTKEFHNIRVILME
jgi:uncharacterized membrane protein